MAVEETIVDEPVVEDLAAEEPVMEEEEVIIEEASPFFLPSSNLKVNKKGGPSDSQGICCVL